MSEDASSLQHLLDRLGGVSQLVSLQVLLGLLGAILAVALLARALLAGRDAFGAALALVPAGLAPFLVLVAILAQDTVSDLGDDPQLMTLVAVAESELAKAFALTGAIVPALVGCVLVGVGLSRLPRFQA